MAKVYISMGKQVDFQAAVELMDDGIRETVHQLGDEYVTSEQDFINEYCLRHFDKFGESFQVN